MVQLIVILIICIKYDEKACEQLKKAWRAKKCPQALGCTPLTYNNQTKICSYFLSYP
jgi:hypothetical protein